MFGKKPKHAPNVVELIRTEAPPYAETIPLRLSAVEGELVRLRGEIDGIRPTCSNEARLKSAGLELHFITERLLDALSGKQP